VRGRLLALTFVAVVARAGAARAAPARFAVVIGNDVGGSDEPRLRYAETDARRIAQILTTIGDFPAEGTTLLEGRSAADVRAAIASAHDRLVRAGDGGVLLLYYSGHADGEALHLGGTLLPFAELRAIMHERSVATRLMIVDACRSGVLTAIKGGHAAPGFDMTVVPNTDPHGMAIVTSSAAGEESQESPEIQASFFTHHLATGLLGAADVDGDGAVTLGEAYAYAAKHTVASTSTTWAGPQHPTYALELGGREDLVLTWPGRAADVRGGALGRLTMRDPGWYFVRLSGDGALVAELTGDGANRPLALRAGRYEVVRRADDHLLVGDYDVLAAGTTAVDDSTMRRIDFGRVVRKGGTVRRAAAGVYVDAGVRGPILGLGVAPTGGVGGRLDLRGVTATLALDFAESSTTSARGSHLDTTEIGARADAMKALDLRAVTVALGVEAGFGRWTQSFSDGTPATTSYAPLVGPTAVAELPLGRRYFVWLQAAAPFYAVDVASTTSAGREWHATYRCVLATGGYL
jgi:hypothetical protein